MRQGPLFCWLAADRRRDRRWRFILFSSAQPTKQVVPAPSGPPPVPVVADAARVAMCRSTCGASAPSRPTSTDYVRTQGFKDRSPRLRSRKVSRACRGPAAQIDPRPFQAQLDQAIANREERTRRSSSMPKQSANATRSLWRGGYATPQTVDLDKANTGQFQRCGEGG